MVIIFGYLDRHYLKAKAKSSLSKIAMNLYKSKLFEKLKCKIFIEIDRLINEERNGNLESRNKIKKILELFNYLNLEHPQIIKGKNEIKWINKDNHTYKIESLVKDIWIGEDFCEDSRKFVEAKAKNYLKNMPINEYILSLIIFLENENIILNNYMDPKIS